MTSEIKPRVDGDGVPVKFIQDGNRLQVFIAGEEWFTNDAVKRMAVELEAWRSVQLWAVTMIGVNSGEIIYRMKDDQCFDTIGAAVDALMAGGEG